MRRLAHAYLEDVATRASDVELQLASYRTAAMRQEVAERLLPSETLAWLLKHSFLFAKAAALELGESVSTIASFDEAYKALMSRSEMLPLGDIVGAGALRVVADRDAARFTRIIYQALSDSPNTETIPAGSILQMSFHGNVLGEIELPEPSPMTGNIHPWLVLAQLAVIPMGGAEGKLSPNGNIIATVGAFDGFLRRVEDERWRKMMGFHFHEFPGKGSVPCLNNGVVEPVGNAMIAGFHLRPAEMVALAEHAIVGDFFQLAWRLNAAARELVSATDTHVAGAAEEVVLRIDEYLRANYVTVLH
jgi:hypothetical protein